MHVHTAVRRMQGRPLTGIVVDSGAAVTHVVPVVDGYVLGSNILSIPVAGDNVTLYLQQLLGYRQLGSMKGTPF